MRAPGIVASLALASCAGADEGAASWQGGCRSCHVVQGAEHDAARHGQAARSVVFEALRVRADEAWSAGAFCDGCHLPVGGTDDGLDCLTCHAAYGNLGVGQGALLLDPDGPIRGPSGATDAPHDTGGGGFLQSADLCGTCHEVEGPGPFSETPFSHWQKSPAADRNTTCQDCHMPKVQVGRTSHRPVGLVGSSPDEAQALLSSALRIEIQRVAEVAGRREVDVRVTSTLDGHHVPDGASFLRALWIEVRVPAAGYASASAPADGPVLGDPRWLSARLFDGDREVAVPTAADRAVSGALAPGEHRDERFRVPAGGAQIQACVRFRRYRVDLLQGLGLPPAEAGPAVDVVCHEVDG